MSEAVKELIIEPGKNLSYQRHKHRNEFWFVSKGSCKVNHSQTENPPTKPAGLSNYVNGMGLMIRGETNPIDLTYEHVKLNSGNNKIFLFFYYNLYLKELNLANINDFNPNTIKLNSPNPIFFNLIGFAT